MLHLDFEREQFKKWLKKDKRFESISDCDEGNVSAADSCLEIADAADLLAHRSNLPANLVYEALGLERTALLRGCVFKSTAACSRSTQVEAYVAADPPSPQAKTCLLCAIVDAAAPLTANADPNGIHDATNQQVGNIQTAQARAQDSQVESTQRRAQAAQQAAGGAQARSQQQLADTSPVTPTPAPPTPCPNANSGLLETQPCIPASCINMNHVVHLQSEIFAPAPKDQREVVGFFTNNSISDVTCTWAFHKNGQWAEIGTGYVKKTAVHQGGQGGGIWTVGADSWDMQYSCFMGIDPVDAHGHFCTLGVTFSGQTKAGTDIR
jgi:hypothetical protein